MEKATSTRRAPLGLMLLLVPLVVVVMLAGLWVAAGVLAPTYDSSFVYGIVWFVLAAIALRFIVRARPDLKLPLRGTFVVTAVVVAVATLWTTQRDDKVDEDVVMASQPAPRPDRADSSRERPERPAGNVLVASGTFEAIEKDASGKARVIELPDGTRKLTLTDFEVVNGPDYRVYLATGEATISSVPDYEDLGGLKGNVGDQQYEVPKGVDVAKYDTVVIWCRAFSSGIAQAPLKRS